MARPKIDVNLCVFKPGLMQISAHISWEIMQFNATAAGNNYSRSAIISCLIKSIQLLEEEAALEGHLGWPNK